MWIVFRDPQTAFRTLDKFVIGLVEDEDIYKYQDMLARSVGGRKEEFHTNNLFLQSFVSTTEDAGFYVRRYEPMTLNTSTVFPVAPKSLGKRSAWTTPVSERRPGNTSR